jgi:hypothetical protein
MIAVNLDRVSVTHFSDAALPLSEFTATRWEIREESV